MKFLKGLLLCLVGFTTLAALSFIFAFLVCHELHAMPKPTKMKVEKYPAIDNDGTASDIDNDLKEESTLEVDEDDAPSPILRDPEIDDLYQKLEHNRNTLRILREEK